MHERRLPVRAMGTRASTVYHEGQRQLTAAASAATTITRRASHASTGLLAAQRSATKVAALTAADSHAIAHCVLPLRKLLASPFASMPPESASPKGRSFMDSMTSHALPLLPASCTYEGGLGGRPWAQGFPGVETHLLCA